MRFGHWRGVTLAIALASAGWASSVSAGDLLDGIKHPTIPPVAPAVDLNTGGPFYMPPVPYGHYAKDPLGHIHGKLGVVKGLLHGHKACGGCGGAGCGLCKGGGLFHGHKDKACDGGDCGHGGGGLLHGHGHDGGACGGAGCGLVGGPGFDGLPAGKTLPIPAVGHSGQCDVGHGGGGLLHGHGDPCGGCGGAGCGLCKGGLFHGHKDKACGGCGGAGCGHCKGSHLAKLHGLLYSATHPHAGRIQYFVGAGGPVPLTPGYVPYVVPVRSPRDFLAFPPYTPDIYP